jgi:Glu-tRNA(Gln) amidotransferase subunit E-like FAD-binding protein
VEIKGVHHHRGLPLLVHTEAFRQLNLLRVKAELVRRGAKPEALTLPAAGLPWEVSSLVMDASSVLRHTNFQPVLMALEAGEMAVAVRLPGFRGILTHPTQPGVTFAREIADRVRVIACPIDLPFMTHSDLGVESLEGNHWKQLSKTLGAGSGDAVIVVWAPPDDAATAAREILARAGEALEGIPAETRQAFPDGTTGFERILPGADRMYPDTDTPPLPISDAIVAEVRAQLGEPPWTRQERYERLGLKAAMAFRLARSPWADLFDRIDPHPGEPAQRLAGALEKRIPFRLREKGASRRPEWGDAFDDAPLPTPQALGSLVRAVESGRLRPHALVFAVDDLLARPDRDPEGILREFQPVEEDAPDLADLVKRVADRCATSENRSPEVALRWGMGEVMRAFFGRVDPGVVRRMLVDAIENGVGGEAP